MSETEGSSTPALWQWRYIQAVQTFLAVLALILSLISLAWQARVWWGSGPRVVVKTKCLIFDDKGQRGPASFGRNNELTGWILVGVVVRNRGRLPTTIEEWGWATDLTLFSRMEITPPQTLPADLVVAPLPHRLEAHSSATWWVNDADLVDVCKARQVDFKHVRAWVRLGDGRRVYSAPGFISVGVLKTGQQIRRFRSSQDR